MTDFLAEIRRLEWAFTDGLWAPAIVDHTNTRFDFAGANYAPFDDLINGYTVQFSGVAERVDLLGSNNDLIDVLIATGVSVVPSNSAGLQIVSTGSGLSVAQSDQLEEAHGQIERSIYIDTSLGTNGNGYQQSPYNNWTDAVDDAEANGLLSLVLLADATIDRQIKSFTIRGVGNPTLDGNSQILEKCELYDLSMTGDIGGTFDNHYHDCHMLTGLTGVSGDLDRCGLGLFVSLRPGSVTRINDPRSDVAGLSRPTLNVGGGGCLVSIRGHKGGLIIAGADNVADEVTVSMAMGRLRLDSSNTDGVISCRGVCDFDNQAAGSVVETSGLVDDIIFNRLVEAGFTFEQLIRIAAAFASGDVEQQVNGDYIIRGIDGTTPRITGTPGPNNGRVVSARDGS